MSTISKHCMERLLRSSSDLHTGLTAHADFWLNLVDEHQPPFHVIGQSTVCCVCKVLWQLFSLVALQDLAQRSDGFSWPHSLSSKLQAPQHHSRRPPPGVCHPKVGFRPRLSTATSCLSSTPSRHWLLSHSNHGLRRPKLFERGPRTLVLTC